ncbi:MAG: M1 family metallopeptidase [Alphaproteobacteria bacterium]|nr:M1 family metallopeptidase [Alphaproteobacteria bacterium]
MTVRKLAAALVSLMVFCGAASADANKQTKGSFDDKFRQLDVDLPTPNTYRAASGAPGEAYWQQQADYVISATLDETAKRITGSETVSYRNNSPHDLSYLWFQLDQNIFKRDSDSRRTATTAVSGTDAIGIVALQQLQSYDDRPQGFEIQSVADGSGGALSYVINDTMMRVDLPRPLSAGKSQSIRIAYAFNITDNDVFGGRSGYERFPETDTYTFFQAQWFPRLVAYTDYTGWQHKQFLGNGEFTLEFGDYDVSLTLPADHIVGATGVLQNPGQMLSAEQRRRLEEARSARAPMYIVTPEEALANEKEGTTATKTWRFKAENVRDFAWASSRKFIWDAMGVDQDVGADVLAQSFFPNEADPLWSKYSTRAVAHTIDVYSDFSFPYPYPSAISVNTWKSGGMEYPMISFNGYRPVKDEKTGVKTYTRNAKYGLIGVVIHEVGHNYFPMIVNSDERQWTWMDEGINSFLEHMAELLWDDDFPVLSGNPNSLEAIGGYMMSEDQVPVMVNSESIKQFGNNAYSKPAAALTVLRETVMGRELFDFAFKEYSRRWRFKRPTPSDLFRTMEDASGVDLDWFWRGWFYTTDHVDIALETVREYRLSTRDPEIENPLNRDRRTEVRPSAPTAANNREQGLQTYVERHPEIADFYDENDEFVVNNKDRNEYSTFRDGLKEHEKQAFERALRENPFIYFIDFRNLGGLVSPLPLKFTYEDGTTREEIIPAEIWRRNNETVTKVFVEKKKVVSVELDSRRQTADADAGNNSYPARSAPSRLDVFRQTVPPSARNQMSEALTELKGKEPEASATPAAPLEPTTAPAPASPP